MTARSPFRNVLLALACAALVASLGGCGRKGPLDLPPQARAQVAPGAPAAVAPAAAADEQTDAGVGSIFGQSEREPEPVAARGKRKFILDPLLGD